MAGSICACKHITCFPFFFHFLGNERVLLYSTHHNFQCILYDQFHQQSTLHEYDPEIHAQFTKYALRQQYERNYKSEVTYLFYFHTMINRRSWNSFLFKDISPYLMCNYSENETVCKKIADIYRIITLIIIAWTNNFLTIHEKFTAKIMKYFSSSVWKLHLDTSKISWKSWITYSS